MADKYYVSPEILTTQTNPLGEFPIFKEPFIDYLHLVEKRYLKEIPENFSTNMGFDISLIVPGHRKTSPIQVVAIRLNYSTKQNTPNTNSLEIENLEEFREVRVSNFSPVTFYSRGENLILSSNRNPLSKCLLIKPDSQKGREITDNLLKRKKIPTLDEILTTEIKKEKKETIRTIWGRRVVTPN